MLRITVDRLDTERVPESFIKHRWTKHADDEIASVAGKQMKITRNRENAAIQYCILISEVSTFCSEISSNQRAIDMFTRGFKDLQKNINIELSRQGDVSEQAENQVVACSSTSKPDDTAQYRNLPLERKRS